MKKSTESALVRQVLDYLKLKGYLCWRSSNHAVRRTDQTGRQFHTFHGLRGVSDILAVIPHTVKTGDTWTTFGVLMAVETKSATGTMTAEQAWFLEQVTAAGGLACCVRSLAELERFLEKAGVKS